MRGWLVLVFVMACNKTEHEAAKPPAPQPAPAAPHAPAAGEPVQPGTIRTAVVDVGYIVVVPKGGDVDGTVKRIEAALAAAKLVAKVDTRTPAVESAEVKQTFGYLNPKLTPQELDAVFAGTSVLIGLSGEPAPMLRKLGPIARDAAEAAHGWVMDPYTRAVYTAPLFAPHIVGDVVDVREQILVHAVQGDNDAPFADTAGMVKLGFPELAVPAIAEGDDRIIALVNATAETLVTRGDVTRAGVIDVDLAALPGDWHVAAIKAAGGTAKAHWQARWDKLGDDDLEIQLIAPGGTTTDALAALLDECYGKNPETTVRLADDDPDLLAAKAQAQHDLATMQHELETGIPASDHLEIKAPFREGNRTEWMWVDVFAWKADGLTGTLANTPEYVHTVKLGQRVTVKLADVADYVRITADGTRHGGYSIEVMKKRGLLR